MFMSKRSECNTSAVSEGREEYIVLVSKRSVKNQERFRYRNYKCVLV